MVVSQARDSRERLICERVPLLLTKPGFTAAYIGRQTPRREPWYEVKLHDIANYQSTTYLMTLQKMSDVYLEGKELN